MKSVIATAALVAATAATDAVKYNFMAECDTSQPLAKVVNRCSYPVYLWSIGQQMGCPADAGLKLETGDVYQENFQTGNAGGQSIKLSKFETCGGEDITQLEYKIEASGAYAGNYLDMSFVDCTGNLEDCPGRTDGYYLQSGNQDGKFKSAVNNEHCPIFNVYNSQEAANVAYINWDDRQTKYCDQSANLELYLCGGEAPGAESSASSAAPSKEIKSSSAAPTPSSSSEEAPTTTEEAEFNVAAAAAVTEAPSAPALLVKTEVVYVTEYVNKRHAHGARHQHFHA